MSSRQTGRLYNNHVNLSFGNRNDPAGNPSLLASLFGQDNVTGGEGDTPYQGSGGIFGGQSRRLATLLNAQKNQSNLDFQHNKELEQIAHDHEKEMERLKNELTEKLKSSDYVRGLAAQHDVPVEAIAGQLGEQLTQTANLKQGLTNKSLQKPNAQLSADMGVNMGLAGMKPVDLKLEAPQGSVASGPTVPGVPTRTASGALPTQTTEVIHGPGGIPMPITRQSYIPGKISSSVNPLTYDQASQLPPGGAGPNPNLVAGDAISGMTSPSRGMLMGNTNNGTPPLSATPGLDLSGMGLPSVQDLMNPNGPSGGTKTANGLAPIPALKQDSNGNMLNPGMPMTNNPAVSSQDYSPTLDEFRQYMLKLQQDMQNGVIPDTSKY